MKGLRDFARSFVDNSPEYQIKKSMESGDIDNVLKICNDELLGSSFSRDILKGYALLQAAKNHNHDAVEKLLAINAPVIFFYTRGGINSLDKKDSPLSMSVKNCSYKTTELLLKGINRAPIMMFIAHSRCASSIPATKEQFNEYKIHALSAAAKHDRSEVIPLILATFPEAERKGIVEQIRPLAVGTAVAELSAENTAGMLSRSKKIAVDNGYQTNRIEVPTAEQAAAGIGLSSRRVESPKGHIAHILRDAAGASR